MQYILTEFEYDMLKNTLDELQDNVENFSVIDSTEKIVKDGLAERDGSKIIRTVERNSIAKNRLLISHKEVVRLFKKVLCL